MTSSVQKRLSLCRIFVYHARVKPGVLSFFLALLLGLSGCDRMITPRTEQLLADARRKAGEGEFIAAINLYETALDGSAKAAAIHYELALLYDDKMNEPLHALHHFKRYLILAPAGKHAAEVKEFMKRDELALVTAFSGDSIVTRQEAARLRNENLTLRQQLRDKNAPPRPAAAPGRAETAAPRDPAKAAGATPDESRPRFHTVEAGDTLFSLARKYYGAPDRWKDIREANKKEVKEPGELKIGQVLRIP